MLSYLQIEYNKGIDEEEYILSDAKRGSGWCKFP
jgi:hypothetical protein